MMEMRKITRRIIWFIATIFILMNVVAFFHARKFTRYSKNAGEKTGKPEQLSAVGKMQAILFGIDNPRPENKRKPSGKFETIELQSNRKIEGWYLPANSGAGEDSERRTVILFHGYGGDKSSMLDKAEILDSLGFDTFLVDFMGSGGSEGNITTIGYREAEQVMTAYEYVGSRGVKNIYLFGTSMGAVAILKAISDHGIVPKGIILECPFGSMYKTVCARFDNMNLPSFPMAGLLVFWGGAQHGFWAFGHNPTRYAGRVACPTLVLFGEKDKNVSRDEINDIYRNLPGEKSLRIYPQAGHENYLLKYKREWTEDVAGFLEANAQ